MDQRDIPTLPAPATNPPTPPPTDTASLEDIRAFAAQFGAKGKLPSSRPRR